MKTQTLLDSLPVKITLWGVALLVSFTAANVIAGFLWNLGLALQLLAR